MEKCELVKTQQEAWIKDQMSDKNLIFAMEVSNRFKNKQKEALSELEQKLNLESGIDREDQDQNDEKGKKIDLKEANQIEQV